ncbi:expressed unknown protein [Seminavis robusta]|uniref:Uncharacterized protein n=1 Tax=Seminavis robusta TaxID=568900 RepID=A0A9N8D673_9STRA|nr:expressed unknown protein [Seminavis robusta]|eukprot:Sro16_g011450.1 n/a (218) ;mRNA; f:1642-2295
MGDYNNTTFSFRCRGRENYQDHCTHNGPSAKVWFEIFLAAGIIFGFFSCVLRWSERRRNHVTIEWNQHDEDSTDLGASYDFDNGSPTKRQQRPYYHMHPALSRSQKSLRAAKDWLSSRLSLPSQQSMKSKDEVVSQKRPESSTQSSQTSFYTAPSPVTMEASDGSIANNINSVAIQEEAVTMQVAEVEGDAKQDASTDKPKGQNDQEASPPPTTLLS